MYLPFSTSRDLEARPQRQHELLGRRRRSDDPEGETGVNAPCTWLQYWVQLDTPEKAAAYKQYLTNYSDQQRAAGRFERPTNVRLRNVMEWLDYNKVVPGDVRLQVWLAFGFLLVCLLNTVGLLLAKFLRRSGEIGVRRALGASRRAIFAQCLVEAGTVGLAGGVLGLGLAMLGLWAVRQQPVGLRRPRAPGPGDAADHLRARHRRQPAGRPACRPGTPARSTPAIQLKTPVRLPAHRPWNSAPSFPPCAATRPPPR